MMGFIIAIVAAFVGVVLVFLIFLYHCPFLFGISRNRSSCRPEDSGMYLLVKGKLHCAVDAAHGRGFDVKRAEQLSETETYLQIEWNPSDIGRDSVHFFVAEWFAEDPKNAPFPDGTLLHYSFFGKHNDAE